jgi:hydrogenase maturation protease
VIGPTLVVGLGNPLMTDDGIGLAALERLRAAWSPGPESGVELVDGGTWGLFLLPEIERAGAVVFLDAIRTGTAPGTVVELEKEAIPGVLGGASLSVHQIGLRDLIALATIRGTLPERTVAIGIEPRRIEMGDRISSVAEAALDSVVERTLARLASWGIDTSVRMEAACTR